MCHSSPSATLCLVSCSPRVALSLQRMEEMLSKFQVSEGVCAMEWVCSLVCLSICLSVCLFPMSTYAVLVNRLLTYHFIASVSVVPTNRTAEPYSPAFLPQNDLGSISSEIQSLQDQSHSMSIKLKNRQVHTHTHTHIHTHTHTHTHTHSWMLLMNLNRLISSTHYSSLPSPPLPSLGYPW